VFTRWSTSSRTSLLLILEVVDDTDEDFDTADIVDGDDVDKNSVDEREDTVEGVEHNAGDSTTNESTRGDTFCFFFLLFCANLPTIVFFGGGFWIFTMVAMGCYFYRGEEWVRPVRSCVGVTCGHKREGTRYRNKYFDFWKFDFFFLLTFVLCRNSIQLDVFYEGIL